MDNECLKHGRHLWTMGALYKGEIPVDNGCLKHIGDTCAKESVAPVRKQDNSVTVIHIQTL